MKTLSDFAAFVKNEKLEAFADEQLKIIKPLDIPLMKLFQHLTEEQLKAQTITGVTQFLNSLESGTAYQIAEESLKAWEEDRLPGISKNAIQPSDLVLIYYVQKTSLLTFLPLFTKDVPEAVSITQELEQYYSKIQDKAVKLLFKLQKAAEAETKDREAQLREAQEIAKVGSYEWDMINDEILASDELYRIYDVNPEVSGFTINSLRDRIHPEDVEKNNDSFQKALSSADQYLSEYRVVLDDNSERIIQARGKFVFGPSGEAVKMVGTIQDVTELKKTERALAIKTKELEQSNSELQRFASVASHDLKEPLRKIYTFTDLLASSHREKMDEEEQGYIDRILVSCSRMATAIDDLLTYSKLGAEKEAFVNLDLNKIISEILDDFEVTIKAKNAKVEMSITSSVYGAPSQIRQLFRNLIANALKFTKENVHPVIKISTTAINNDTDCFIAIEDNGIGFDEKYKTQIFEVFQRLHGKDKYEGSGIGLAICKKIIENHGGLLNVRSQPDVGTTFEITLPLKA